ncbi:MAG: peptide/nickel transport system permease protein [Kiritimatiellia bacterium]|jgi:peptide/nickel transport system permease protein
MSRFPSKHQLLKQKGGIVYALLLAGFIGAALLAPVIAPHNPYDLETLDIMDSSLPPRWIESGDARFILGTDDQGRDILSTMLYGLRISLIIGIAAVCLQMVLGVLIGLCAGYFGGRLDAFFMRVADIQLSFSTLMVAIIALAICQAGLGAASYQQAVVPMLICVIGIAEWPQYARTMRVCTLAERKKDYISAARSLGTPTTRILFGHILPNTFSPILVISTLQIANAIVAEAALSFLGLGMPPSQPSLGSLIRSGFEYVISGSAWWITTFPAVLLIILILTINLLGDCLRDALDPRQEDA